MRQINKQKVRENN